MSKYLLDLSALGGFILFALSGWTTISLTLLMIGYYFFHQWIQGAQYISDERLDEKTAIVTGATSGIGKEVARILSSKGARVVIGCRDLNKGRKVLEDIRAITHGQVVLLPLDLSSFQSVREFARKVLESEKHGVHILVNNAGSYAPNFQSTPDGNEETFQVNYLGHFLLVNLLLPLLKASAPARIINMTSKSGSKVPSGGFENVNSEKEFDPKISYDKSKVANALFTKELARRLKGTGVSVYGVNPGATNTQILKLFTPSLPGHAQTLADVAYGILSKTPESGAQTTVYCALNEDLKDKTGGLFSECKEIGSQSKENEEASRNLWVFSENLLNLDPSNIQSPSIKIFDINDTPLPPLPADATPENEESPSFPPSREKTEEMIIESAPQNVETFSSPAFDDAPAPPSPDNINNILDKYENIGKGGDISTAGQDSQDPINVTEANIVMTSTPQSFAVEEEEIISSSSGIISEALPSNIEDIQLSGDADTFDLLDNIKSFDKKSLSHLENIKDEGFLPSNEIIEEEKKLMNDEINKNKDMFSDVKDQILEVSPRHLKNVDTVVKENLPDKYDILSEKGHQEVLSELSGFDSHELQKAKSPSIVNPQELLRREIMNKEIEDFSSDSLIKTDPVVETYLPTKEDIKNEITEIESDVQESKKIYSGVMSEVSEFKSSNLKPVDTEESVYLPDKIDLSVERALKGVMAEVKEHSKPLSHIEHTKEPLGPDVLMAEEINRHNTLDSLVHFDKANLKHSEVEEKAVLPSVEDIEAEKVRNTLTHDLEYFEKSSLKSTTVNEKNVLPDYEDIKSEKQHVELLSGIESFPRDHLRASEVKEPISPAELAKQELTRDSVLHEVESYDKSNLIHSTVEEKNVLPSSSDIAEERQHLELLTGIESFDPHALKASSVKEPISPMELAKQELAHSALLEDVEAYDKLSMHHRNPEVKNLLPTSSDILHEREQFLDDFKEPKEMHFEQFSSSRDTAGGWVDPKSRNMSGSSSGSLESNMKGTPNPLSAPLSAPQTLDDQRTSSSDEWVKLDKQSGGDLLG